MFAGLSGWPSTWSSVTDADIAAGTTTFAIVVFTAAGRWALRKLRERWT